MAERERWGTRIGVIMAVAGSAVGLGNFLRFPAIAAQNGGGAFMIPYFVSLVLLGLPLMWIEWTAGRYSGSKGHTTAPGLCGVLTGSHIFRVLGVLGLACPIIVFFYYTYIESWLMGYAFFAVSGAYDKTAGDAKGLGEFLSVYRGTAAGDGPGLGTAYTFFLMTFGLNFYFLYRGISGGIEKLCNWALPVLFLMAIVVAARVLTLGTPDAAHPENCINAGLGFLWNPDFTQLSKGKVWLDAAGQIFFTLSVGFGVILCYAGYVKRDDDVALSGLTATAMNEFAEVILGGSIVIPLAVAYLGVAGTQKVAGSLFTLGFVTTPLIFHQMTLGWLFAFLWYALLFLAGITSSVSLAQPVISFLQDEFKLTRQRAVLIVAALAFLFCNVVIFWGDLAIDEMDTWGGKIGILIFGFVECIAFFWIFGADKAWAELQHGARLRIPVIFRYIMQYVTPTMILAFFVTWFYQEGYRFLLLLDVTDRNELFIRIALRVLMLALVAAGIVLIWRAARRSTEELAGGPQIATAGLEEVRRT